MANPLYHKHIISINDLCREELELVQGASNPFDLDAYRAGQQTPVFFGSGVNNFGVQPLLDFFVKHAPAPQPDRKSVV